MIFKRPKIEKRKDAEGRPVYWIFVEYEPEKWGAMYIYRTLKEAEKARDYLIKNFN